MSPRHPWGAEMSHLTHPPRQLPVCVLMPVLGRSSLGKSCLPRIETECTPWSQTSASSDPLFHRAFLRHYLGLSFVLAMSTSIRWVKTKQIAHQSDARFMLGYSAGFPHGRLSKCREQSQLSLRSSHHYKRLDVLRKRIVAVAAKGAQPVPESGVAKGYPLS